MQLMRHESMETTLKFYVGRNAEKAAEAIWETVAQLGDVSGDTAENEEKSEGSEMTQVVRAKESKEMRAQGLEPWTYGLKVRCSTN